MSNRQRPEKRRPSSSGINSDTIKGLVIGSIALILLGVLALINHNTMSASEAIDKNSSCKKEDIQQVTVVLIDRTDKLDTIQQAALETRLWDIAGSIPKNSEIKVYTVDQVTNKVLDPEIDLCSPGTKGDVNEFTGNKKITQDRYENKFREPLNAILKRIFVGAPATQSPIMEALQSVAVTSFLGDKYKTTKKKLILASDLLQYNKDLSLYGKDIDFDKYKESSHWKSVKADLQDVDVEIFFLHRKEADSFQNTSLRNFWIKFFEGQGAIVSRFLPIEG